jgi:crotonobetainyl-CoA:carnitine CoA-transferase CaiB-like acyl-CoA transferase
MQWSRLCKCLGRDDWLADPRFAKNAQRMVHKQELDGLLSGITIGWDKQDLSDKLGVAGVPCGPVNNLEQAFAHPQVRHRGIRVALDHPVYGKLDVIRSPLRFSRTPVEHRIAPALGADTKQVLASELGIDATQFAQLQSDGLV